jgi:O-antigen ligase
MLNWLVPLWVFLLPFQFAVKGFLIPRFAPADALVLAYIPYFLTKGLHATGRFWHKSITALLACFLLGNLVFFFTTGEVSKWAVSNKTIGLLVVILSYSMVGVYASAGWNRIHRLTRWFVRVATLHALLAILAMAMNLNARLHINYAGGLRLAGFLIDPNAFGGLLAAAFVIALVVYFRKGALHNRVEGVVSCSLLALGTFLTYSRSCWLGLVAGTIVGLLVGRVRHRAMSLVVVLLLGLVVYYAAPAVVESEAPEPVWEFTQHMATRQGPIEGRMQQIDKGLKLFAESPIWGKGLGYMQEEAGGGVIHNTVIWLLVEMGALGAAAIIWFILGHFRRAVFNVRHSRESALATNIGLLCSFVAMVGLTAGIEALYQRHWWMIIALISSAYFLTRTEKQGTIPARGR